MIRIFIIIFSAFALTSCFDENSFVIKPIPTPATNIEVKIPFSMYEYQTFYNLMDSVVVSHNNYADWDLGFEASSSGYHIILNASKFMYAGNTGITDFNSVISNTAATMIFDNSNGNLDSTAIGNWADFTNPSNPVFFNKVYIINRGVNEDGISFGYKKIIFEKLENNTYYIHFANIDNTDEHYFQIPKNTSVNFVQFSFDNGGNLNTQQPDKDLWDLCFTKYSSILLDDNKVPTPYIVRGVLINNGLSVAKDTITSFASINFNNINSYTFSTKKDAIGYDWKIYKNDIYSIVDHYSYIIKDRNNVYYKLRFTGFYNSIKGDPHYGIKGYPSFEFIKLNNQPI
ncbi:MAG: HmuY family protein [Bacteroidales bacterium]|nr:HmuY family protein [Bacteroidales bacterium]